MKSNLTFTDQFCGAGGSSQGVRNVALKYGSNIGVKLALNHWKQAIATHEANFPDTQHDCTDIQACDPRYYPTTDILITSPECTNHSLAKGKKQVAQNLDLFTKGVLDAAAERSRATMWDVCRFAERHNYKAIIVENVVDARKWIMWDAWLQAMHSMGYSHKCVYINSMHCFPTPQSRDRMYVVFWKSKQRTPDLEFKPKAYCPECGHDINAVQTWKNNSKPFGKFKTQYYYSCPVHRSKVEPYYHAAFNCIDWTDIGKRIGDRSKPLSPNTIRRIEYGLKKYGKEPLLDINYTPGLIRPITTPVGTITTNDHHGLVVPFLVNDQQSTGVDFRVKSLLESIQTISTNPGFKLVMPFVMKGEHTLLDGYTNSIQEPFSTQTTRQTFGLICPFTVECNRTGKLKPASQPFSTVTAGAINQGVVSTDAWQSFLTYYNGNPGAKHMLEAAGTITTGERHFMATYQEPRLEDCYYRMLKPKEIQAAMAFAPDYIVLGDNKAKVKQLGNAVTPPAMEWLVEQVVKSLI